MFLAGIPLSDTPSSMTSVFVSGFNHDFLQLLNNDPEVSAKYKPTGMSNSILANRISWFYDFKAASLTVDTACSSSMVAFHLGCQSLRNRESEMAVVSGVNVLLWPNDFVAMSHHGFLSPDGKCYSFDRRANGYSRGEGVGTVILKRLSDAIRDGDTIRAVVRGTGVNQDGRTPGITLPNGIAQTQLIRDVYARAGIDPSETIFIESHGTGTPAGDPIEARAIAEAFKSTTKTTPLYIGAMKSSIGHLEGAAGIASIIKSVMLLESGIIPPNTNFEKVNPKIPANDWNLQFPTQPIRWPAKGTRRISINCMGFGGTNAHVILDDAYHYINDRKLNGVHQTSSTVPSETELQFLCAHLGVKKVAKCRENGPENGNVHNVLFVNDSDGHLQSGYADSQDGDTQKPKSKSNGKSGHSYSALNPQDPSLIFMLSVFDEEGISRLATAYTQYFKTLPTMTRADEEQYMANLAYTLSAKRSKFAWRSFFVAASFQGLKECLETGIGLSKPVRVHSSPKLGFVFTGQGAQWYAMGRELLHFPVFRRSLESADQYVKSLGSSWSLLGSLVQIFSCQCDRSLLTPLM
jgi:acyl transferase domain-containing protein